MHSVVRMFFIQSGGIYTHSFVTVFQFLTSFIKLYFELQGLNMNIVLS